MRAVKSGYTKLFRYMGSKHKYLDIILPLIDKNKTLIEPFCGSAAVSLNSENSKVICNDNNKYIIDIFNGFKEVSYEYYLKFISREPRLMSKDKENFYAYRDYYNSRYKNLDSRDKSLYQILLIQSCINSMARWGPNGFNQGFGSRSFEVLSQYKFDIIKNKIKQINFTNSDYLDIINEYDSEDSILFLDPPYVTLPGSYSTNFNQETAISFIDKIKSLKSQIIYTDTINDLNIELMENPRFKYKILGGMTTANPRKNSGNGQTEIMFYSSGIIEEKSYLTKLVEE